MPSKRNTDTRGRQEETAENYALEQLRAAERSVIAAMLLDAEAIARARALLDAQAFHLDGHGHVFAAVLALDDRGEPADIITVAEELQRRGNLEAAGGPPLLAQIIEGATTAANVEEHCRIVRAASARRRLRHLAFDMQQRLDDSTCDPAALWARVAPEGNALVASLNGGACGRFAEAAVSAADLVAQDIPQPRSLLSDGLLVAGGFAILYGKPGLGKSWLALDFARSLVRGEPWLGLRTPGEGVRVGVLHLELPAHAMRARLDTLGVGAHERDGSLRVLCRPNLRGVVDLCQPAQVAELRQWIVGDNLDVLVVDALSRAHSASENKAEELGPVLAALDALRYETGCAIVLVHHERKPAPGAGAEDDHDALRGSTRLQSDPTLLVRVKLTSGGLRCLVFVKVTDGPTPEAIYYRLGEDGQPGVVHSPESVRDNNREAILRAVLNALEPVARGEVVAALSLTPATVKRHLEALLEAGSIARIGENKATRYTAPTGSPAQPAHEGARAGELLLNGNELGDSEYFTGSGSTNEDRRSPAHRLTPALPTGERAGEPVTGDCAPGPAVESESIRAGRVIAFPSGHAAGIAHSSALGVVLRLAAARAGGACRVSGSAEIHRPGAPESASPMREFLDRVRARGCACEHAGRAVGIARSSASATVAQGCVS